LYEQIAANKRKTVLLFIVAIAFTALIGYAIGAWGGRPFLERYGRYLLIRPHEIELADHFFQKYGAPTAFFSRLLPIVRTQVKELISGYIELASEVGNIDNFIVPPALGDHAGVLGALHLAMAAHPGLAK